jgi:uncharacterized membrane protein YphA (DoxX/SURF4 family)
MQKSDVSTGMPGRPGVKPSLLLVLPRVFLGIIFLVAGYSKSVVPVSVQMFGLLNRGGVDPTFAWYRSFTHSVVLPHADVFGALLVLGEIYVGVALLFGVTTRLAAAVAIFLLLNFMCAKEVFPWNPSICDSPDIVLCLVIMIGAAGRTWGLDRLLHARYPTVPIW